MADAVDTIVLEDSPRRRIIRITNLSDGTGESAVVKVDKSALVDFKGVEPRDLIVDEIEWAIQGFTAIRLFWDHTTDDEIAILPTGSGYKNYWSSGGLKDPRSAGGTGDIILTTDGEAANATYDITINCRLTPG